MTKNNITVTKIEEMKWQKINQHYLPQNKTMVKPGASMDQYVHNIYNIIKWK
jgi:hypothetical protein